MPEENLREKENVIAEWSVHRVRGDPRKLTTFIILVLLANAFLLYMYRQVYVGFPFFAVLGNLILMGSVSDYLFPIKFTLTDEGAHYKNLIMRKHISWERVMNCYLCDEGIKLSPLKRRSWVENFRGFVLLFNNNREEVIEHVKRLAANRLK